MSRDDYNPVTSSGVRSPGRNRRLTELPTVDRSPSRDYGTRGSPLAMGSPYYRDMDEPTSPAGAGHHRSRSASRPVMSHGLDYPRAPRYQSLDRGGLVDHHDREFIPIREPRDRSRDRSLERGLYLEDELYGRSARQSPNTLGFNTGMPPVDRGYHLGDLQHQNTDLQRELAQLKRELELTNQKLGSSMHSIKTFWSPELKKERALRKEESAKYSLINDQLKLLSTENQKQAMLVRQLEEELRARMRQPNIEMQQQIEAVYAENDHLQREISILRETIKDLECRVETQKQTLIARDESIKKLLEMLQAKGMGKEEERQMFQQMQAMAQKQMYGNYPPTGSPPLPDIIGQYYSPGYGGPGPYDLYGGPSTSAGYLYDPAAVAGGYYGQTSPIRRRRYSIAGLPSASMMNDYYGYQPVGPQPLHQSSSSNIINLLNEAHKSISRSSQILGHQARLAQAQQAAAQTVTPLTHYPGRVISSYPTLHPGDTSPPYLNDNLMQMSASFSSQPNMYFQQYTQPPQTAPGQMGMGGMVGGTRLRPAYSVSNLNYLNQYPSGVGMGVGGGGAGIGGSKYAAATGAMAGSSYINPYSQTIYNPSDLSPYNVNSLIQQRNLMSSLHASNPAISQMYQQHQQQQQQQQYNAHQQMLAHNIQQQFAGTQHYAHTMPPSTHPSAHIHASVQQQLNPDHQFHIHQHQNHLQTHPLAALASTTAPFPATLTSSALHDVRSAMGGSGGGVGGGVSSSGPAYDNILHSSYPHHHLHQTHSHSHMQHPLTASTSLGHTSYHHPHHISPYSKLDLDYPKLPQEHKRQVSFKFDVDTLSLDS